MLSWNGTTWDKVEVDNADYAGYYTSLALDSLNRPHICYSDGTYNYVKYATFNAIFVERVERSLLANPDTIIKKSCIKYFGFAVIRR